MIAFALDGVTSFSVTPIRFISLVGFLSFVVSLMFGAYFLFLKWVGHTETGWTSLITSIWLLGGLQLMALGLIGEYIGKTLQRNETEAALYYRFGFVELAAAAAAVTSGAARRGRRGRMAAFVMELKREVRFGGRRFFFVLQF